MTTDILHEFVSAQPDGANPGLLQPSDWNHKHIGNGVGMFNVLDPTYGAVGDGTTDDSAAFQAAATAAIAVGGTLRIPAPPVEYKITSTIQLLPATGSQFYLTIHGDGYRTKLKWAGAASGSIFHSRGWKNGRIDGIALVTGNIAGVTCWDIDADSTYPSTGFLTFTNCTVEFGTGGSCVGWRGGRATTGAGDVSFLTFVGCLVSGTNRSYNDIGWLATRNNALNWNWYGGAVYLTKQIFSNVRPGGGEGGGASMFFYGIGASGTGVDFEFMTAGTYRIQGGRFETGLRFLTAGGGGSTYGQNISLAGLEISAYAPADGKLFALSASVIFLADDCWIGNTPSAAAFTASMIYCANADPVIGSVKINGGIIQAADPCYTVSGTVGQWRVELPNVGKRNDADYALSGYFANPWVGPNLFVGPYDPRSCNVPNVAMYASAVGLHAFTVDRPVTVSNAHIVPSTAAGNVDVGIYRGVGTALTRIASTGSVACPTANLRATIALTAAVTLVPGVQYYAALSGSSGSTRVLGRASDSNAAIVNGAKLLATVQDGDAFPLPASRTLNTTAGAIDHHFIEFD